MIIYQIGLFLKPNMKKVIFQQFSNTLYIYIFFQPDRRGRVSKSRLKNNPQILGHFFPKEIKKELKIAISDILFLQLYHAIKSNLINYCAPFVWNAIYCSFKIAFRCPFRIVNNSRYLCLHFHCVHLLILRKFSCSRRLQGLQNTHHKQSYIVN